MENLMFNTLCGSSYYGIVTILNYEIRLNKCISKLSFPPAKSEATRKIIVDLALKSGMDKYRFVEFPLDIYGKINTSGFNYVEVDPVLEYEANKLLQECKDIVLNSILPSYKKEELLAR